MGQYGALGYAVDEGWSSAQILDHYYGGTVAGDIGNPEMTVELVSLNGKPLVVTGPNLTVNGVSVGSGAVRLTLSGDAVVAEKGTGCVSDWQPLGTFVANATQVATTAPDTSLANLLGVCEAAVNTGGVQMTVNHLPTESYLRGVVPRESPAYWGSSGGGRGMQALMAQSVAARSYAWASSRASGAHTCDTTSCQVYGGAGVKTSSWTALESASTDTAIASTAGVIRVRDGVAVRTEFSSSTGGWTVGGDFPAVEDVGDATASNPYHNWTTSIDLAAVGTALGTGPISSIVVTGRNGLGADGGRVTSVKVVSTTGGATTFTGDQVRIALGLNSDWFVISGQTPAQIQAVVKAMYADLLLRDVDPAGLASWSGMLAAGASQAALVNSLTGSDEYINLRVRQAYEEVLGREPEPGGVEGWRQEIVAGRATVDDVKRRFYDTQEYYNISGGTPAGYVALLYQTAFERAGSPAEVAYWSGQIPVIGRGAVVDGIWMSLEAAKYRAGKYYVTFLKRSADQGGQDYWGHVLLASGEGAVRTGIAGSDEYRALAVTRFP